MMRNRCFLFRDFRLIDLNKIKENGESWDLMNFQNTIDKQIQDAVKYLKINWFGGIQEIFLIVSSMYTISL